MSFVLVGMGLSVGGAVLGYTSANKAQRKAERKAAKAQEEMDRLKDVYASLDTSNPYADMENTMEDLTVNQQEADFMRQQQQQSQANIMQQMKGAAGGSGIAALAQTLANQGAMDAQKAAVSIGKQEAANQQAERSQQAKLNMQEAMGERESQRMNIDKQSTMLGMSQSELAAQRQAVAAADKKMWSGISGAAGALSSGLTGISQAGGFGKLPGQKGASTEEVDE